MDDLICYIFYIACREIVNLINLFLSYIFDNPERPQAGRQKSLNSKRGDRRNLKVPHKAKYDPFSLKAGLLTFNSAAGVNGILGTIM